jgi:hypothetical protein
VIAMSLETTLARGEALAAEAKWKDHRLNCPTCQRQARKRAWNELCSAGKAAHLDYKETAAELKRQAELDQQPSPDQMPLFNLTGPEGT